MELRYGMGTRPVEGLREDLIDFWAAAEQQPELQERLVAHGLDISSVSDADRQSLIDVRNDGMGFEPGAVELVIALAPTANVVLIDVWRRVVLPWVQARRGEDALGEPKDQ